ncbi:MAG: Smr/MutS family protein [Bacteroidota bacterium]|jgi:hypothetical protein|nr:Smr/MutS family protein [Sphingobacteriales bacterium]
MSRVSLGDKVRFVNENMQGVVTRLEGNTAGVTIEDDFEIPVLISEIVKIDDVFIRPQEVKAATQKPHFVKIHYGIHIAFDKQTDTEYDFYLHNSETDWIQVAVYCCQGKKYHLEWKSDAGLEQTIKLSRLHIDDFQRWSNLFFQISFLPLEHEGTIKHALYKPFKISQKEFFAAFKTCYFLNKQAICFRIDHPLPKADITKLKNHDFSASSAVNPLNIITEGSVDYEIDLHAEKLIQDLEGLSASDIVSIQMLTAEKALEQSFVLKKQKIIFIHGVGNHFLKNKIKNLLGTSKSWVKVFNDADPLKYGGGATEVWLK